MVIAEPNNPFTPPSADLTFEKDDELASRWQRLGAAILDSLCLGVIIFPALWLLGFYENYPNIDTGHQIQSSVFGLIAWLLINVHFLKKNGQTVGKKLVGIKIVKQTGESANLTCLGGIRYTIPYLFYHIPVVGTLIALINCLMIFRSNRRCLHDDLASTKVIIA